jgi:hypothetical protein
MRRTIFAGVLALAASGVLPAAGSAIAAEYGGIVAAGETAAIDLARIKRALQLTPEQEPYWPPIEAALHDLARREGQAESAGLVRRVSHRVVSIVLDGAAVGRLARVARPLIERLSDDQKRSALALAQEMGLAPVLAALN